MTTAERLDIARADGHDHRDSGELVTVTLSRADAIAIAQQLRAQGRDRRTPTGARDLMSRVGNVMWSACRIAVAVDQAERRERAANIVERLRSMGAV